MGVLEVPVDPAAALAGQLYGQFARCQHDLPIISVDPIAINVDVAEGVVTTNLLELAEGLR